MIYIAYNNFNIGKPTQWKLFTDPNDANQFAVGKGIDWDMTNYKTFKDWYPALDIEKDNMPESVQ